MAYDPNNLSALSYANRFTLWHYKTPDAWAEVLSDGYFRDAAPMFRVGDVMHVNASIADRIMTGTVAVVLVLPRDVVIEPLVAPVAIRASAEAA